jgi:hypothetical protein
VASYSFNEPSGTTVVDGSGYGNNGTGAGSIARTSDGKFGGGIYVIDGGSITVPDAASLDLTTGMTVEAWVNPDQATAYQDVVLKETSKGGAWGLYAFADGGGPASVVSVGHDFVANAGPNIPLHTWTHLATTYDGATLRLYRDGALVAQRSVSGAMATSSGPLKIGGNSIWDEPFEGRIDDVRVYNRPLAASELATDMKVSAK